MLLKCIQFSVPFSIKLILKIELFYVRIHGYCNTLIFFTENTSAQMNIHPEGADVAATCKIYMCIHMYFCLIFFRFSNKFVINLKDKFLKLFQKLLSFIIFKYINLLFICKIGKWQAPYKKFLDTPLPH